MPPPVRIGSSSGIVAVFCSPLLELAGVLVRLDNVATVIVNANHWTVNFITG
jgi:hypothetical protein